MPPLHAELPERPEILAPVGSIEQLEAAIHNGAGAVYVGYPRYHARRRGGDLSLDELHAMRRMTWLYGLRLYLACNILIFESEIDDFKATLAEMVAVAADGWIIQDPALSLLLGDFLAEEGVDRVVRLHASTQMTLTHPTIAERLSADLGLSRVVLPRELSRLQVSAWLAERSAGRLDCELEVFIHGAICISVSGQCHTSRSFGGRSANRGECAQSCRLAFRNDNSKEKEGSKLFSARDLSSELSTVAALSETGVDSLKIEGRLKSELYVAAAVRRYRNLLNGKDLANDRIALSLTYARFSAGGWLGGVRRGLVESRSQSHRGIWLGVVESERGGRLRVRLVERQEDESSIWPERGDGILIADYELGREWGGPLFALKFIDNNNFELDLGRRNDLGGVGTGCFVYWNGSPQYEKELRQSFENRERRRGVSIELEASGRAGEHLSLGYRLANGAFSIRLFSDALLEEPRSAPLGRERLASELSPAATSPLRVKSIDIDESTVSLFLPQKSLKDLRQRTTAQFVELLESGAASCRLDCRVAATTLKKVDIAERSNEAEAVTGSAAVEPPSLRILIRHWKAAADVAPDLAAIPEPLRSRVDTVVVDPLCGVDFVELFTEIRRFGYQVGFATPRTLMPGEESLIERVRRAAPDLLLLRSTAFWALYPEKVESVADFSFNIANSLSARYWLSKGIERFTPAFDLSQSEWPLLAASLKVASLELPLLWHEPLFYMEYCLFEAEDGRCMQSCRMRRKRLLDPRGEALEVFSDLLCRNQLYAESRRSLPRTLIESIGDKVGSLRIEFSDREGVYGCNWKMVEESLAALERKIGAITTAADDSARQR